MEFNEELRNKEDIYGFSIFGTVIYSLLVFLITYIYLIKKDYNEHYKHYFDVNEYKDCYIKNISFTDYILKNETEIKLYSTISSINFTDYITDNIDNITEYTYFYKSNNYTYLSDVINKTIQDYLFQNITCYSDKKNIYLNNDNDYQYQNLFVYEFFLGYFSLSLFLCTMTCMIVKCDSFYENDTNNNNNNNNNINIVYINNNGNNNDENIV